ncbi:hypothetical protein GCM10010510_65350 [Streptomyces anandii JCM 4720]|nr:hypothetical protein GCM10010510_65350 [Streptomyces anandii JCM 4720]
MAGQTTPPVARRFTGRPARAWLRGLLRKRSPAARKRIGPSGELKPASAGGLVDCLADNGEDRIPG